MNANPVLEGLTYERLVIGQFKCGFDHLHENSSVPLVRLQGCLTDLYASISWVVTVVR